MSKMVWIILLQMLWAQLNAQYKEYPKLQKLYDAGKYEKCIKKAEGYSKNESKEPLPYLYAMKSWLAIADNDDENKSAVNKAIAAARKAMRKDKEDKLYERFYNDYDLLNKKAFAKADALVKNGKCSQAIRIYGNINELFGDRLSNYKKSLCMLQDENMVNDGFILLRNTIIGVYKDYKSAQPVTPIPDGFARLSKEYLKRAYFYNAEDVLRKGVEVFPADTIIRNEMLEQSTSIFKTSIQSDLRKDLYKL
jgi:tetratricopeptide (TPR) repeat protein